MIKNSNLRQLCISLSNTPSQISATHYPPSYQSWRNKCKLSNLFSNFSCTDDDWFHTCMGGKIRCCCCCSQLYFTIVARDNGLIGAGWKAILTARYVVSYGYVTRCAVLATHPHASVPVLFYLTLALQRKIYTPTINTYNLT